MTSPRRLLIDPSMPVGTAACPAAFSQMVAFNSGAISAVGFLVVRRAPKSGGATLGVSLWYAYSNRNAMGPDDYIAPGETWTTSLFDHGSHIQMVVEGVDENGELISVRIHEDCRTGG